MITEDYVSFEVAKLLKEKGFDEKCYCHYSSDGRTQHWNYQSPIDGISAPSLQMTMKWLRQEKHYYIQVMLDSWAYGSHSGYYIVIQKTDSEFEIMLADKLDKVFYDEPEEAYEAAIKYILENLI